MNSQLAQVLKAFAIRPLKIDLGANQGNLNHLCLLIWSVEITKPIGGMEAKNPRKLLNFEGGFF